MTVQTPAAAADAGAARPRLEAAQMWLRDVRAPFLFLAPSLLLFAIFLFYPLLRALVLSFQKFDVYGSEWVGMKNYAYVILHDAVYHQALLNTAVYTVFVVPVGVAISLGLAVLLFPLPGKIQAFFRGAYYLPGHMGAIILSLIWLYIFAPLIQSGLLNYLLHAFRFPTHLWLADSRTALGAVIMTAVIGGHGGGVILYLAAMGAIPRTIFEAAAMDAASAWTRFRRITWPLIKPTTVYIVIISTIASFQVFGTIYVLTQGGPEHSTTTLVYQIYDDFSHQEFGLAAAQAFILGVLIVAFSLIQYRFLATDVEY